MGPIGSLEMSVSDHVAMNNPEGGSVHFSMPIEMNKLCQHFFVLFLLQHVPTSVDHLQAKSYIQNKCLHIYFVIN
jgi:hypothetical protein